MRTECVAISRWTINYEVLALQEHTIIIEWELGFRFLIHGETILRVFKILISSLFLNMIFRQEQHSGRYQREYADYGHAEGPSEEIVVVSRHPVISVSPETEYQASESRAHTCNINSIILSGIVWKRHKYFLHEMLMRKQCMEKLFYQ